MNHSRAPNFERRQYQNYQHINQINNEQTDENTPPQNQYDQRSQNRNFRPNYNQKGGFNQKKFGERKILKPEEMYCINTWKRCQTHFEDVPKSEEKH